MSYAGDARQRTLELGRNDHLAAADEHLQHCFILTAGMVTRERTLADGRRQIVGLYLPGDVCGLTILSNDRVDHDMVALSRASCVAIESEWLATAARTSIEICRAVWRELSRESALSAAWTTNVGQRESYRRIAHLMCEIEARAGQTENPSAEMEWPGTQADLCAATGLSLVHANRTLQKLREDDLATCGSRPRFRNFPKLRDIADFDPTYLACEHERLGGLLLSRVHLDPGFTDVMDRGGRSSASFGASAMQRGTPC